MNPYESPKSHSKSQPSVLDSAIVERLITADGTEDLVFYDVSDHQLYGRKHRQKLTGDIARRASDAGCDAIVYQTVLWWCFVFIPIIPLGVYAVIPRLDCDDPDSDADQYRGIRVEWDWVQIAGQYAIVLIAITSIGLLAYWWWSTS